LHWSCWRAEFRAADPPVESAAIDVGAQPSLGCHRPCSLLDPASSLLSSICAMVGKSKKSGKSTVAKKASAVDKTAGARRTRKESKPSPTSKRATARSAAASSLGEAAARAGGRAAAKTGNKKKGSTISVKKIVCDGRETDETLSSLADSSSEESDFEDGAKAKAKPKTDPKSKAGKKAPIKTDQAVKGESKKERAKPVKAQAKKTKPRATKQGRKPAMEDYAVPSPKKVARARAAASAAASYAEDDDGLRSEARGLALFPESPKTDDWRLAAAIDY
jgi:hypothetical protein